MTDTTAFKAGQLLGVIIVLVFVVGLAAFFVISLIKSISTRKTGWIIGACVSGVPFLLLVILFIIGFAAGFKRGLDRSGEIQAAKNHQPSQLLTAPMTSVTGNSLPYQISIPSLSDWQEKQNHSPYDYVFDYRDAYVGVIAEGIGVGSSQRVYEFTRKNIAAHSTDYTITAPSHVTIDTRDWMTYDATATIQGIKFKYRYYVYSDENYSIQIINWTGPVLFDHFAPVFDRIAQSFKLPPAPK